MRVMGGDRDVALMRRIAAGDDAAMAELVRSWLHFSSAADSIASRIFSRAASIAS